ncbi:hypothetical protein SAMN02745664_11650 [Moraxella cuniculi DSM 21768]|uniref:Uncharacterized protein n=1 Tax=Moraxella cuniculi DSM 21768 TaxID=1122245 RepID=A0A1N7FS55_9GAMM|nr:hypothetical protein [Moraxella cuniculi]OOS08346.1 hypothetical protein B0189_00040 [Moraxella cuniculi]SIS03179.1 hypothetical protein SAMN02745664_11650 [Moraxella cuniculi DSM 21768]
MHKHISDIRNELYKKNFKIDNEIDGNEHDVSKYWVISHIYNPLLTFTIMFYGLSDDGVLPIEDSYGCELMENKNISLYFIKNNQITWKKSLEIFVDNIQSFIADRSS